MGLFFKKSEPQSDDPLTRLEAEYQNYRRRTAQELETASRKGARRMAAAFLPIYDDLQRALSHPSQDEASQKGVEMICKELLDIFAAQGIVPMDSMGKIFSPTYHEAVEHVRDDIHRPGEIVEVLRVGFTMDEEVLRHARVIVANCE